MNNNIENYDLVVIGWGKAGKTIAQKIAARGKKVAIIEASTKMYGGTCINIGCIPTKSFITSAHDFARHATAGNEAASFKAAQEKRNALIGKLNSVNYQMAVDKGITIIDGYAKFIGHRTIAVQADKNTEETQRTLTGETIIINTGSTSVTPPIAGINGPKILDSTSIQFLKTLPKRLTIIGGGPIGLEFASIFNAYGTEVTVVDMAEKPLAIFDEDVAETASKNIANKGITFVNSAGVKQFEERGDEVLTHYEKDGKHHEIASDYVLVAIGRRPATDGLQLEKTGVETTPRGAIKVDDQLRTTAPGIYAVGDVNGGPQFTYISFDDHRVVMDQLIGAGTKTTGGRVIPTCTFIEPPLATVGLSEKAARENHHVKIVSKPIAAIAAMPRPKILGQTEGLMKFIIDEETDQILGATIYSVDAQDLINLVALAMRHGITATEMAQMIYTHPSGAEAFNEVLG